MTLELLKGKIHRATVIQAELDYVLSEVIVHRLPVRIHVADPPVPGLQLREVDLFSTHHSAFHPPRRVLCAIPQIHNPHKSQIRASEKKSNSMSNIIHVVSKRFI